MSKIDQDLAGALRKAKTKKMYFALVEKTPGEGTLIVYHAKVSSDAINDAKKDLGGGKVYTGLCEGDPKTGALVFKTAKSPPAIRTLTAVIRRDAGVNLKVESLADADVPDDDADPKAKTPLTAADVVDAVYKEELANRLVELAKSNNYKTLMSRGGPIAEDLKKRIETVKALIGVKNYKMASQAMDELQKLVDKAIEPT